MLLYSVVTQDNWQSEQENKLAAVQINRATKCIPLFMTEQSASRFIESLGTRGAEYHIICQGAHEIIRLMFQAVHEQVNVAGSPQVALFMVEPTLHEVQALPIIRAIAKLFDACIRTYRHEEEYDFS